MKNEIEYEGILLFERVVSLEVQKAYEELRNILLKNNCKIIAEEPSKSITVEHGSLWGVSSKGVKKKISFNLLPHNSGTRIVSISSLTSDWINISIFGYGLIGIFAFIFGWIAIDLEALITARRGSFWGWLAEAFGYTGFQEALVVVNLFKILSIFSVIVLIVSMIIDIYIYARRNSFSEEVLRLLP
jgi:hypothetical protein